MKAKAELHGTNGLVRVTLVDGSTNVIPRFDAVMRARGLLEMVGKDNPLPDGDPYTIHVAEELIAAASEAHEMETGEPYESMNLKLLLQTRTAETL